MGEHTTYIVVCQQAWCNSEGFGIHYGWDGEQFATRKEARKHGFEIRESDDFNIGVLRGRHLVSFDWMDKPVGETDETMQEIASELGLKFKATAPPKPRRTATMGEDQAFLARFVGRGWLHADREDPAERAAVELGLRKRWLRRGLSEVHFTPAGRAALQGGGREDG